MTCKVCGVDNPSNARFCGHCGSSLVSNAGQASSTKYPLTIPDPSKPGDPNTIIFPFHGKYVSSPNGRLMLGWGLALAAYRIVVMKDRQILWQKDLKNPIGGAITDNGLVAVIARPWPSSSFVVFKPDGELFFAFELEADFHIEGCGLDPQETFAWCTSFTKLLVFSLSSRTRVLNTGLPKWPVTGVSKVDDQIHVETKQIKYIYSNSSSELLNGADTEAAWERFLVSKGSPIDILAIANQHLQVTAPQKMAQNEKDFVVGMLHHLLAVTPPRTHERARSNRMLGEIALACGDKATALLHFKAALGDDPKIGVAVLAKRLEKETSGVKPEPNNRLP